MKTPNPAPTLQSESSRKSQQAFVRHWLFMRRSEFPKFKEDFQGYADYLRSVFEMQNMSREDLVVLFHSLTEWQLQVNMDQFFEYVANKVRLLIIHHVPGAVFTMQLSNQAQAEQLYLTWIRKAINDQIEMLEGVLQDASQES